MYDVFAIYNRPRDVYDIVIMNSINHCDVVIIDDDNDDMIVLDHCDVVIIDDDNDDMIVLDHCDDMIVLDHCDDMTVLDHCDDMTVIDHCDEAAAAAVGTAPDEGIKEFFDRHGNVLYYHVFLIIHFIYKH